MAKRTELQREDPLEAVNGIISDGKKVLKQCASETSVGKLRQLITKIEQVIKGMRRKSSSLASLNNPDLLAACTHSLSAQTPAFITVDWKEELNAIALRSDCGMFLEAFIRRLPDVRLLGCLAVTQLVHVRDDELEQWLRLDIADDAFRIATRQHWDERLPRQMRLAAELANQGLSLAGCEDKNLWNARANQDFLRRFLEGVGRYLAETTLAAVRLDTIIDAMRAECMKIDRLALTNSSSVTRLLELTAPLLERRPPAPAKSEPPDTAKKASTGRPEEAAS